MKDCHGDPSESGGPVSGESEVIESEIAAGNVTGQPPFAEQFNFEIEPGPGMEFNTWIDREYVWGPGDLGFDELICQHTPARDNVAASVEYAVHDDAGDLVALLNRANPTGHGRVAWQATYDPYGQPRVAEMPSGVTLGFAYPRIGHKGLFVERLDTTTMLGTERLVSNARLLYHARNRWLQPTLGRWTSRDPNGLGQPVQKSWAMHGVTADVSLAEPNIRMSWRDGANLHQYVRGNPVMASDEMGLFGLAAQAASAGMNAYGSVESAADMAMLGYGMSFGVMEMMADYAAFQMVDVDWATDWSDDDQGYSTSVAMSYGIGPWADDSGGFEDELSSEGGPAIAGVSRLRGVSRSVYTARRSKWDAVRSARWKVEFKLRGPDWKNMLMLTEGMSESEALSQLKRMENGSAPRDGSGKSFVMHHRKPLMHGGTNTKGNLMITKDEYHKSNSEKLHKYRKSPLPIRSLPGRNRIGKPGVPVRFRRRKCP